ncbi:MAG: polysaccharide biosynthesis tyrosine autokinase [Actinomycetota bacterium]|nr:polysaccharide biosynthesis tyrosine autokinase [Actinomycetota bacterium]
MSSVSGNGRSPRAVLGGWEGDARSARIWADIEDIDPPPGTVHVLPPERTQPVPMPLGRADSGVGSEGDDVGAASETAGGWSASLQATRALVEVLRSRRRVVSRAVMLCVILAAVLSLAPEPLFEAKASVLVRPLGASTSAGNLEAEEDASLPTEPAVMGSLVVAERVEQRLGSLTTTQLLSRLSVEAGEDDVLILSFRDPYPGRARDGAQAFAEAYLEQRRDDAEQARSQLAAEIRSAIDRAAVELANEAVRAERVEELNRRYAAVTAMSTDPGEVISPPTLPTSPVFPNHARNLALGVLIGALLGVVAALVVDHRDDRIHSAGEVERRLGLPVLAQVPSQPLSGYHQASVAILDDTNGPTAEGFRRLRANLPPHLSSLLVSSAASGEGKGLVAANLAVAYARAGQRVLLVCADLRDPAVHWLLRVANERGLSSVLAGIARISDVVRRVATLPLLDVVPAGPTPDDPGGLLGQGTLQPLLWRLARRYDLIILDAPPVLPVAGETLGLCGLVDAVLLTSLTGRTRRHDLAFAVRELSRAPTPILGTVILEIDEDAPERGSGRLGSLLRRVHSDGEEASAGL